MSNLTALQAVLGYSEGTDRIPHSDNGYRALVGGGVFDSYADHPNQRIFLPRYNVYSTAAGRYQFLVSTWDELKHKLKLPDFSPESQDAAMAEKVKQRGAYDDLMAGHFETAIGKLAKEWASLPGAGYGQREVAMHLLTQVYLAHGGTLA